MEDNPSHGVYTHTRRSSQYSDSDEDDSPASQDQGKTASTSAAAFAGEKRKRERACDYCRHRKIKCNGFEAEDKLCSLCRKQNISCTYVSKSKRRKAPDRTDKATKAARTDDPVELSSRREGTQGAAALYADSGGHLVSVDHHKGDSSMSGSPFSLGSSTGGRRTFAFMGKSSTFALIVETHALVDMQQPPQPEPASTAASEPASDKAFKKSFGERQPWEMEDYTDALRLVDCWPVHDLAQALIDLYFTYINSVLPLLREDDFRSRYSAADYLTDREFSNLCLMVFSLAARELKDDSRTWAPSMSLDPYGPPTFGRSSAGWQFYHQAMRTPRHRTKPADLGDMQLSAMSALFLGGASSNPLVSWTLIGEGLIYAQEVGAHRGGRPLSDDPAEEDAFRRAFWVLFCLDATITTQMGRSFHISAGSFNAPLPGETSNDEPCDKAWTAFRLLVDFAKLLRTTVDTLYSLDSATKSKSWFVQQMKTLHAEADAFQQTIPEELRWDSSTTDERVFYSATSIQLQLQQVLFLIHRPSLPTRCQPAGPPLSPSSFDAAVSAALRTSYIFQCLSKRNGPSVPLAGAAVTEAAGTLGLALLGSKQAGLLIDEEALVQGLQRCCLAIVGKGSWDPLAVDWIDDILKVKNASIRPPSPTEPETAALPFPSSSKLLHQPTLIQHSQMDVLLPPAAPFYDATFFPFSLEGFGFGLGMDSPNSADFGGAGGGLT